MLTLFSPTHSASQSAFLLTPFSSLGLVAEGGSSYTFVKRMGLSTANAALITSSRIPASQLLACGFVNKIFPTEGFAGAVQAHIAATFGSHLNADSMLRIKGLVRASYVRELEAVNVLEHFGGLERFAEGVPQAQFVCGSDETAGLALIVCYRCLWRQGRRNINCRLETRIVGISFQKDLIHPMADCVP